MTSDQKERYNRHIILNEIGEQGQEKLLKAKVLVVGAGGLGAPVLQYLTAAGVGNIGIVDDDKISLSNLQRQVLYRNNEIGELKVERANETLTALNPDVRFKLLPVKLTIENAEEIISAYDLVIGATDNFESRNCIDAVTKKQGKAFVHGSIGEFEGQVSVFNHNGGPSYVDLFPDLPEVSELPVGVIGVLPGVIGTLQAVEAIKIILGIGSVLSGKLLIYNALEISFQELKIC